jgi:hypothetical protein
VSALIVYGSLYPFDFRWPLDYATDEMAIASLFHPFATSRGDLLGNIVLFLPYGFAGIFALGRFGGRIQYFVPERDPSLVDVFWNVVGVVLGATMAATPFVRRMLSSFRGPIPLDVPLLLGGIWVASQLMPLVPSLDVQLLKENLKTLLLTPEFRAPEAFLDFAAWLVTLQFLLSSKILRNYRVLLPALPFAVLAVQPFIISHELSFSAVLGAVVAVAVWFSVRTPLRPTLLGVLLFIGIMAADLYPLDFSFARNAFSWVPFGDLLEGSMVLNAAALLRKAFLYGALVWLLRETSIGWTISTALVFVSLTIQEALQVYVAGATAGVTDPILAVLMAIGMYGVARNSQYRSELSPTLAAPNQNGICSEQRADQVDRTATTWHLGGSDELRELAVLAVRCVQGRAAAASPHSRSAGWVEVPIGLRSEQVSYLKRLSGESGRSLSGTTRHIIAEFIERLSREKLDASAPGNGPSSWESKDKRSGQRSERGTGGRQHRHFVNLPGDYVEFLRDLSGKLGTTMSGAVQMIVDDSAAQAIPVGKAIGEREPMAQLDLIRRSIRMRGLILLAISVIVLGLMARTVIHLPQMPYNVTEIFGEEPSAISLAFFALMLLSIGMGAHFAVYMASLSRASAFALPLWCILAVLLTLGLGELSVSNESFGDVTGSEVLYRDIVVSHMWGDRAASLLAHVNGVLFKHLERMVRFVCLVTPMVLWLAIFDVTLSPPRAADRFRTLGAHVLVAAPWLLLFKYITIDQANTDNLVELIEPGGGIYLYLLLMLAALGAVLAAHLGSFRITSRFAAIVIFALAVPTGWILLKLGTVSALQKEGATYSGIDFLLGPDREHKLASSILLFRWVVVQIAWMSGLAWSVVIATYLLPPIKARLRR